MDNLFGNHRHWPHAPQKSVMPWMWVVIAITSVALLWAAGAYAQAPTPIGPSSWDNADGTQTKVMGSPVFNYQVDDTTWDYIVDEWVQVGQRQVWKSVRGNHRVFADSAGNAIYAKGNHYLGTGTKALVKFDKFDSTWVTLKSSLPDSVRLNGTTITFYGIFPGVNKVLRNNAKVFRSYSETFEFTQDARDSLTTWGPWSGYLLGTATKLNADSLNLSLRDALGVFGIDATGRMVDEWVACGNADTAAFYLQTSYLKTEDSTTGIPVKKWLVRYNGNPWLIELFNPILAAGLPAGTISHNATIGNTDAEANETSMANGFPYMRGYSMPEEGTIDSVTFYGGTQFSADQNYRVGVYEIDESFPFDDNNLLDTSAEFVVTDLGPAWYSNETLLSATATNGMNVSPAVWASGNSGNSYVYSSSDNSHSGITSNRESLTYNGNGWPDPFSGHTSFAGGDNDAWSLYFFYSTGGGPAADTPSRLRQLHMQLHGSVQDIVEHFAGVYDEVSK